MRLLRQATSVTGRIALKGNAHAFAAFAKALEASGATSLETEFVNAGTKLDVLKVGVMWAYSGALPAMKLHPLSPAERSVRVES
jgi:hypothetical protein